MKTLLLLLSLISSPALAQKACFESENNPRTGRIFVSEVDYQEELFRWQNKAPSTPNPYYLYKAYQVYNAEKNYVATFGSDKKAHCYMGCRIAQTTSFATADYVGWLKEDRDLKDCHRSTHFDEDDYVATVRGAQFGQSQRDPKECLLSCTQVYK